MISTDTFIYSGQESTLQSQALEEHALTSRPPAVLAYRFIILNYILYKDIFFKILVLLSTLCNILTGSNRY